MEPGRQRAEAWLADLTRAQREADRNAQPTIRVKSCRGDGRCPECGEDARGSSALACGCCVPNALCVMRHLDALLTEALRQRDACQSGVCSEIEILRAEVERLRHWREDESALARAAEVAEQREMVRNERDQEEALDRRYREERDAAIRENVAADQRGWERAISAVRFALADYPHAGLDSEIGAQVERIVAKKTESAIRERDEARAEALKWRRIRTPTHGSCCTCQGCGLAYESCRCDLDEVCDRADRSEAMLRKCRDTLREVRQTYGPEPGARVIGLSAILSELDEALGDRP